MKEKVKIRCEFNVDVRELIEITKQNLNFEEGDSIITLAEKEFAWMLDSGIDLTKIDELDENN